MLQKGRLLVKAAAAAAAIVMFCLTYDTWLHAGKILLLSLGFSLPLIPLCRHLEGRGVGQEAAALLSLLSCVLALTFFLLIFVPFLISKTIDLTQRMSPTILSGINQLYAFFAHHGVTLTLMPDVGALVASALTPLSAGIAKGGAALISAAGHTIIALVIAYYLLTIRHIAGRHLLMFIPLKHRETLLSALCGCKNAVLGYLAGVLKTSAFVGTATFLGLALLRIEDAWILALFMGVLEILPYFGPILGAIPILISAIPLGFTKTLLALLLVLLVQQMESGIVGPYFTASSTSIHPLTAIIGVFIGGSLFGIAGILLTLPMIIVLRSMWWSLSRASIHLDS